MKLGIVSDIHAQTDRLAEAFKRLTDCEKILCAGDISDQCRFDARAVELLSDRRTLAIRGNNDLAACANPFIRRRVTGRAEEKWLDFLAELPTERCFRAGRFQIGLFHGSPWDDPQIDFFHYVFPENGRDIERIASAGFDIVILGHTHRPMRLQRNGTLIVNPGSCGYGNPPTCASVDLDTAEVKFHVLTR